MEDVFFLRGDEKDKIEGLWEITTTVEPFSLVAPMIAFIKAFSPFSLS